MQPLHSGGELQFLRTSGTGAYSIPVIEMSRMIRAAAYNRDCQGIFVTKRAVGG